VVFVLQIPAGTTAYQANDGRYYGRSELEVKHLPDHEIRARMARGKVARASLTFRLQSIALSDEGLAKMQARHAAFIELLSSDFEAAVRRYPKAFLDLMDALVTPNVVRFHLTIRNDGELTIREPTVQFYEFWSSDALGNVKRDSGVKRIDLPGTMIYPGDERDLPGPTQELRCKPDEPIRQGDLTVHWKVFLDNAPPSEGELDLGDFLQSNLEAARSSSVLGR
jgi:hypothetical protein